MKNSVKLTIAALGALAVIVVLNLKKTFPKEEVSSTAVSSAGIRPERESSRKEAKNLQVPPGKEGAPTSVTRETAALTATAVIGQPVVAKPTQNRDDKEDFQEEETLMEGLKNDPKLNEIAEVNSVECKGEACTAEFEAKSDEQAHGLQMAVVRYFEAHQEYGTHFVIQASEEDPRIARFTFSKQKL